MIYLNSLSKSVPLIVLLGIITSCTPTEETCTGCVSPAVSILTLSAEGDTLKPPQLKMVYPGAEKIRVDTSDSRLKIYGNPGIYEFILTFSDEEQAHISDIKVGRNSKMTCEHPVTKSLTIEKTGALKKISSQQSFKILSQTTDPGCGQ